MEPTITVQISEYAPVFLLALTVSERERERELERTFSRSLLREVRETEREATISAILPSSTRGIPPRR